MRYKINNLLNICPVLRIWKLSTALKQIPKIVVIIPLFFITIAKANCQNVFTEIHSHKAFNQPLTNSSVTTTTPTTTSPIAKQKVLAKHVKKNRLVKPKKRIIDIELNNELSAANKSDILKFSQIGDDFFQKDDYTNALIEYEKILKICPTNYKAHYMLAQILLYLGDLSESYKEINSCMTLRPFSSDNYMVLGQIYKSQKKYPNAISAFRKSIKLNKSNSMAIANLADCYNLMKDYSNAVKLAKQAIAIDNKLVMPHIILANCYFNDRLRDEAIEQCKLAIKLSPQDPSVYVYYAKILNQLEEYHKAQNMLDTALEIDNNNSQAHETLAYTFYFLKDFPKSIEQAKIAIALAPNCVENHLALGFFYLQTDNYSNSVIEYQLAHNLDPDNLEIQTDLAKALAKNGNISQAISMLLKIIKAKPKDFESKLMLETLLKEYNNTNNKN